MKTLLMFAALMSSHATAKFDLLCSGTETKVDGQSGNYHAHYRIDLDGMRWCEAECRATKPIIEAQHEILTLDRSASDEEQFLHSIDRQTGEDHIFSADEADEGKCERRPFSGFSKSPVKF